MSDEPLTLEAVRRDIWRSLTRAKADARHPWRYPAFSTRSAGGFPTTRTVGLREVSEAEHLLSIHTDVRSDKVGQLDAEPKCSLMFWNPRLQAQLRVHGYGLIRDSERTHKAWSELPVRQHRNYSVEPAPGNPISGWDDYEHSSDADAVASRFRIIDVQVVDMDWVRLDRPVNGIGHKRAAFDILTGRATWLVP